MKIAELMRFLSCLPQEMEVEFKAGSTPYEATHLNTAIALTIKGEVLRFGVFRPAENEIEIGRYINIHDLKPKRVSHE